MLPASLTPAESIGRVSVSRQSQTNSVCYHRAVMHAPACPIAQSPDGMQQVITS
jgi:hypothetical protein